MASLAAALLESTSAVLEAGAAAVADGWIRRSRKLRDDGIAEVLTAATGSDGAALAAAAATLNLVVRLTSSTTSMGDDRGDASSTAVFMDEDEEEVFVLDDDDASWLIFLPTTGAGSSSSRIITLSSSFSAVDGFSVNVVDGATFSLLDSAAGGVVLLLPRVLTDWVDPDDEVVLEAALLSNLVRSPWKVWG